MRVTKQGHYRPHGDFLHAANIHLRHRKQKLEGYDYSLLSSFLLSAFAFEAYLNLIGRQIEIGWEDFDKASVWIKLRHVCGLLQMPVEFDREPLQVIKGLFRFRNKMAHAKDEEFEDSYEDHVEHYEQRFYNHPWPAFFEFATIENAERCIAAVAKTIEEINNRLPNPDPIPLQGTTWSGGAELK